MWMKNGERCLARWLLKGHAVKRKPKAQNHTRRFYRHDGTGTTPGGVDIAD
jgi:hypothetical protein